MTLGEKLKELRENHGLYQRDISKIAGVGVSTISGYEKDEKRPKHSTLEKIADFYGVTVDYLLDREDISEFPPSIMKIANDLKNIPDGEMKDNMLNIIQNMIKMVDDEIEKTKGDYKL